MAIRSFCCILALTTLCFGFHEVGYSQDFLKQLEQKLRSKSEPAKAEGTSKDTNPSPPSEELLPSPKSASPQDAQASEQGAKPTNPFLLQDEPSARDTDGSLDASGNNKPKSSTTNPRSPGTAKPQTQPQRIQPPRAQLPRSALSDKIRTPDTRVPDTSVIEPPAFVEGVGAEPGYLGLIAERSPGGGVGLVVVEVTQGSPAWKAGFQIGDRILGVNGVAVTNLDELGSQLASKMAGEPIRFLVNRAGKNKDVVAVLQNRNIAARTQPNAALLDPTFPAENSPAVLGLAVANLSDAFRRQFGIPAYRGAAVTDVAKGSPADRAGLRAGDCVVEVDGEIIQNADAMQAWISNSVPGQHSSISYYRGRSLKQAQVLLTSIDGTIPGEIPMTPDEISRLTPGTSPSPGVPEEVRQEIEFLKSELRAAQERIQLLESRLRSMDPPSPDQ